MVMFTKNKVSHHTLCELESLTLPPKYLSLHRYHVTKVRRKEPSYTWFIHNVSGTKL